MLGDLVNLLTAGAGGGIIGGALGLLRQWGERKERLAMEQLQLERDRIQFQERDKERAHELSMAAHQAESELQRVRVEGEAAAEVANQGALQTAVATEFQHLKTSTWIDNLRASVRPVFAYWILILFSGALGYFAVRFHRLITPDVGSEILLSLIDTLIFMATSITTFYYVSRRNAAP